LPSWAAYFALILETWNWISCILVCFLVAPNENNVEINLSPKTIINIPIRIPHIPIEYGNQL
jgi:hypothetical protein